MQAQECFPPVYTPESGRLVGSKLPWLSDGARGVVGRREGSRCIIRCMVWLGQGKEKGAYERGH